MFILFEQESGAISGSFLFNLDLILCSFLFWFFDWGYES